MSKMGEVAQEQEQEEQMWQELEAANMERHYRTVHALKECIEKGVSEESLFILCFETGINWTTVKS